MAKKEHLPITTRALIQRINRKLADENQKLKIARNERIEDDFGKYYVIDILRNEVKYKWIELDQFGDQLGVLQPFEKLVED